MLQKNKNTVDLYFFLIKLLIGGFFVILYLYFLIYFIETKTLKISLEIIELQENLNTFRYFNNTNNKILLDLATLNVKHSNQLQFNLQNKIDASTIKNIFNKISNNINYYEG